MKGYRFFEHPADAGVYACGGGLEQLFRNAAQGLYALAGVKARKSSEVQTVVVPLAGEGNLDRLLGFLQELVFWLHARNRMAVRIEVHTQAAQLELIPVGAGGCRREIKGVSYHGAVLRRTRSGWEAEFLCDL